MKLNFPSNDNENGFGVLEIVLLIGLISGMAYYLIANQQARMKEKQRTEFDHDINNVYTLVSQVLSDPYNCTATVLANPIPGTISSSIPLPTLPVPPGPIVASEFQLKGEVIGGDLPSIRFGIKDTTFPGALGSAFARAGGVVFTANQEVYPGFQIGKIKIANDRVNDFIRIEFKYTDKKRLSINSGRAINRNFILSTKKEGLNIKECRLRPDEDILIQGCRRLGQWKQDLVTGKNFCEIENYFSKSNDLFPLYLNANGDFTNVPPVPVATAKVNICTCPTIHCVVDGYNCCTPHTCIGNYPSVIPARLAFLTEDPAIPDRDISNNCIFKARCLAQPAAGLLK